MEVEEYLQELDIEIAQAMVDAAITIRKNLHGKEVRLKSSIGKEENRRKIIISLSMHDKYRHISEKFYLHLNTVYEKLNDFQDIFKYQEAKIVFLEKSRKEVRRMYYMGFSHDSGVTIPFGIILNDAFNTNLLSESDIAIFYKEKNYREGLKIRLNLKFSPVSDSDKNIQLIEVGMDYKELEKKGASYLSSKSFSALNDSFLLDNRLYLFSKQRMDTKFDKQESIQYFSAQRMIFHPSVLFYDGQPAMFSAW